MSIPLRNIVRMASASLASTTLGLRRPVNMMLALTDRCTGACVYCQIPQRKRPEMSLTEILRLLDEASAMGVQRVGLWGGEPLLRDDLGPIIRHIQKLGMFVTVDTNGHLIPECEEALQGVDHVNISLDGDRAAHDANRGPGAWDRTMRGIMHSVGRYRFWTITVLSRHNLDQIDWILDTAKRLKFLTTWQPLHHNDQLGCNEGLYPEDHELREAAKLLMARKKEGLPVAASFKYLEHLRDWPDYRVNRLERFKDYPECLASKMYFNVDTDGGVYPCSLFVDEMEAPDAREMGLAAAFGALPPPPCRACSAACFTEYNLLYGLDFRTGLNWVRALRQ